MANNPQKRTAGATYGEYATWPEDGRWELIDGIVYDMTPGPGTLHQGISTKLLAMIFLFFSEGSCEVFHAPFDVRLPKKNEPDEKVNTVVQPDILVVCDPEKLDEKGCRGAPDLVIEIL